MNEHLRLVNTASGLQLLNESDDVIAAGSGPEEFVDDLFDNAEQTYVQDLLIDNGIIIDVNPYDIREIRDLIREKQRDNSPTSTAFLDLVEEH